MAVCGVWKRPVARMRRAIMTASKMSAQTLCFRGCVWAGGNLAAELPSRSATPQLCQREPQNKGPQGRRPGRATARPRSATVPSCDAVRSPAAAAAHARRKKAVPVRVGSKPDLAQLPAIGGSAPGSPFAATGMRGTCLGPDARTGSETGLLQVHP
ncbi:hypothetical protein MYCTH_2128969 [Thermothelomyces thermophilus ATCC 42464]|uniref:Uncharacterized protein n=1 Tax=Thermothelomyces thermophilus (strain ATCC 42464 / BCRC 31852 / DSM 1799) TaxID=573729 RepID=G2QJX1_THET4|nr:uncharacterized protein MYCTH_2128969 [Thermothelomyces thermophilus ATCC 42464]AEO59877.1 hypothetical protein MYCTH_2128969 [Thermothelomyces thermophilus ATCC 42464]